MVGFQLAPIPRHQVLVFVLTWWAYAAANLVRKPISVAKPAIGAELGLTISQLGWLDTASLLPYALFQIYAGSLGDLYGARLLLTAGLLVCSLTIITVGILQDFTGILFVLALCGIGQSFIWPACAKALAPWFSEESRTSVLGMWGTCQAAGGLIGTVLSSALIDQLGWRASLFWPAMLILAIGWANYVFLLTPQEVGVTPPNQHAAKMSAAAINSTAEKPISGSNDSSLPSSSSGSAAAAAAAASSKITLREAFSIPNMLPVTICFLFLKLTRYVFILWLPMYFHDRGYSMQVSGILAVSFEVGNTLGTAVNGAVIGKFFGGRKIKMIAVSSACLVVCLLAFISSSKNSVPSAANAWVSGIIMFLAGACEPGFVITGAVSTELGEYGGRSAHAALAGIINGLGGLGAVIQGPLVGLFADRFGWSGVFYVITALCCLAVAVLLPAITTEVSRNANRHSNKGLILCVTCLDLMMN